MTRLDPGYSGWRGAVMRHHNYAQLQMLKLQLEVGTLNISRYLQKSFQDRTIDRNEFSIKSEAVWSSMKEVDNCDILCSKH